jgi:hypothetical protein
MADRGAGPHPNPPPWPNSLVHLGREIYSVRCKWVGARTDDDPA